MIDLVGRLIERLAPLQEADVSWLDLVNGVGSMDEKSTFEKLLDNEQVTEAEVKQMWAEAPVMTVSQQAYDEMMAAIEDDPKEINRLAGLMREETPWH